MVDVQVAPLGCASCLGQGLVGHEPRECLGDQSVQRGGADLVREPRDLGVDEPGGVHREPQGGLGDPPRAPGRQVVGLHPGPDPRQAVLQLHRVRHQRPPGLTGDPQRGRELGQAELRHPRRTRTRQRQRRLPTGDPRGRLVDRLRRVLLGPEHRTGEDCRLRSIGGPTLGAHETEHVRGAVQLPDPDARARLHTPNSSTDHRQAPEAGNPTAEGNSPLARREDGLVSTSSTSGGHGRFSAYGGFDRLNQRWVRLLLGMRGSRQARPAVGTAASRRTGVSTGSTSGGRGCFSAYGVSTDRSSLLDS